MISSAPGATFEAVVQGFPTGLTGTIGVRILDNVGGTTLARTTAGITEIVSGGGVYAVALTAPTTGGYYSVVWDDGSISGPSDVATEDLLVTYSAAASVPAANEYVTAAELKATLSLTGETFADADITLAVDAASRLVDNLCGRRFWVDPTDVTRYYTATTPGLVTIDDLATLTSVATDIDSAGTYTETMVENTDYHFEPLNAAADGWPRTRLVMHPNSTFVDFPAGERRSVRIVGKFGWPAVPPAVKQATAITAARLMRRAREAPFGVVALGTEGEAMRIGRVDPDVQMLLNPYVRSFFV